MNTTRPLAIFGGTFDPVHVGHLRAAWEASDALDAGAGVGVVLADWLTTLICIAPRFLGSPVRHGLKPERLDGAWFLVPAALLGAAIASLDHTLALWALTAGWNALRWTVGITRLTHRGDRDAR